ncbi:prolipoprotein diacylglyceryl transferase [Persephonella sp. KM09-Lau-8]|uniref:prolipoprotein diacylglyceryl transferase n=1 Tax=Persephonella sp. KM09-Lau-8 TaxID=1158345 RepID=UPI0004958275|nr:prolipoprotein diacylglyceryl transferase [Persephonella sp. KM09-Lau-8]
MFPDLIKIGDFTIHTYGVMVAIGLIVSYFTAIYFGKKEGIESKKIENLFIYTVLGGIVGARIAYIIEHHDQFHSFMDYIAVWKGGIDWFGGFIGGAIVLLFLLKKYSIPILKIADVAGISIIIGHAFGRIGCTCAGCCYGKPVPEDSPFKDIAITFPHHPDSSAPAGIPLYPTQPAEAIGNFIIFGLLFLAYRKKIFDGEIFGLYLILYGFERFLLEFWRGVTPPLPIGLTWNQIVTLGMVVVGIVILGYGFLKRKNEAV